MLTYRYIRWTLEPVQRRTGIEDVVKVYFDIDSQPAQILDRDSFIQFLKDEHNMQSDAPTLSKIRKALTTYGVIFRLDLKTHDIRSLEVQKDPPETLRETMQRVLREPPRAMRKNHKAPEVSPLQSRGSKFFDTLGSQSLN